MNINWAAIANEMKILMFVKEYLQLEDYPEIAVIIAAELNRCGSLSEAMQSIVAAMKGIERGEDEECDKLREQDEEDEGEEDVD